MKDFIYSQIEEFIKLSELNISNEEIRKFDMKNKFFQSNYPNVNAVIGRNFPDLKGAKLNLEIKKQVDKFTDIFPGDFDQDEKKFIMEKVRNNLKKTMEDGTFFVDNSDFTPWFKDKKGDIEDLYWNDYKKFIYLKKDGQRAFRNFN